MSRWREPGMVPSRGARWKLSLILVGFLASLQTVRAEEPEEAFRIGMSDVLQIAVWKEKDLSTTVQVRPDGMISIPVVGEFKVAGRTPKEVELQLAAALGEFVMAPSVTVIVEQINSLKIFVTGNVTTPGVYDVIRPTRVLQAIALAGGTTAFAKTDRIVVLREGAEGRFEVNLKAITRGRQGDNILLRPGDTIIVP